jgi:hypothetical protein
MRMTFESLLVCSWYNTIHNHPQSNHNYHHQPPLEMSLLQFRSHSAGTGTSSDTTATATATATAPPLQDVDADAQQQQLQEALRVAMGLWTTKLQYNTLLQNMGVNVTGTWKAEKDLSVQRRKALTDATKQYKKSIKAAEGAVLQMKSNEDFVTNATSNVTVITDQVIASMDTLSLECRSTVKLYQEEIDALSKRCKAVEQDYAAVYTQLMDVPDPAVLFTHCQEVISVQNQQVLQCVATINSLQEELQQSEQRNGDYTNKIQQLQHDNGVEQHQCDYEYLDHSNVFIE